MANKKRNLIKEAIQDANKVRDVAKKNAEQTLLEHFRETLREKMDEATSNLLKEEVEPVSEGYGDEETVSESMKEDQDQHDNMAEAEESDEDAMCEDDMDGLDLDMEEDGDMSDLDLEGGDEGLDETVGFTSEDLREALEEALLQEVEHPVDKEPEVVDTGKNIHDSGVLDDDKKEDGWQNKQVPAKKDWTVKESVYQKKIAKLVAENKEYKRAYSILRGKLNEVNLFNAKLYYANQLLGNQGLNDKVKKQIVSALDSAKTVKEAKNLYESFKVVLGTLSEGATKKDSKKLPTLSETLGSQTGKGLSEVAHPKDAHLFDDKSKYTAERFKKLAGLTKDVI